jgi:hypothetical protein
MSWKGLKEAMSAISAALASVAGMKTDSFGQQLRFLPHCYCSFLQTVKIEWRMRDIVEDKKQVVQQALLVAPGRRFFLRRLSCIPGRQFSQT